MKHILFAVFSLIALLAVFLFYPVLRMFLYEGPHSTIENLRGIVSALNEYSKTNGEYPKSLEEIRSPKYFGGANIPQEYFDQNATLYVRPASIDVQDDFVLLARTTLGSTVIFYKNGSCERIKYDNAKGHLQIGPVSFEIIFYTVVWILISCMVWFLFLGVRSGYQSLSRRPPQPRTGEPEEY